MYVDEYYCTALKMKVVIYSETSVTMYLAARGYIQEVMSRYNNILT
jgi:hypothetical protein